MFVFGLLFAVVRSEGFRNMIWGYVAGLKWYPLVLSLVCIKANFFQTKIKMIYCVYL